MVTYNTMGYSPYMLGLWGGPLAHTVGLTPTELRPRRDAEAALLDPIGLSERAVHALPAQPLSPARSTRADCCCPGPAGRQPYRATVAPACTPR